jgi:hypothetical protein
MLHDIFHHLARSIALGHLRNMQNIPRKNVKFKYILQNNKLKKYLV